MRRDSGRNPRQLALLALQLLSVDWTKWPAGGPGLVLRIMVFGGCLVCLTQKVVVVEVGKWQAVLQLYLSWTAVNYLRPLTRMSLLPRD